MVFSSMMNCSLNPLSNWNPQDQQLGSNSEVQHLHPQPPYIPLLPPPYPPPSQQPTVHHQGIIRPGSKTDQARKANMPIPETILKCPRCASMNTKFCYYNNYSLSQPRYFCKNCRRYWTQGGSLRNVPVGGGCRRNRSSSKGGGGGRGSSTSARSKSPSHSGSTPSNNSGCSSGHHLIRNGSHVQPSPVSFMAPLNHLSDYSIADIGANYPGLIPQGQGSSSAAHFNLLLGNVNTAPSSSGMEQWRFINQQQQLVQQYHHPTFFEGNSEVPHSATTPLYDMEGHVTARETNEHKLLTSTRTNDGADAQMDFLKLERNINSCYTGLSRAQLMHRPYQYNWSGSASENRNANNIGSSSSPATTLAWTELISGFNPASSKALHPS